MLLNILAVVGFLFVVGQMKPIIDKIPVSPQAKEINQKAEDIPEMKDILGSDQETRLKAARKLVERVDVEKAQEILEHSALPHTGEGHLAVHQLGFYAYKKYGLDAILKCKD